MFVIARELVGALKAAKLFASEDETRPVMNSVHVEAVGSALRIVATDGHTLWCCEIPARESAADPPPLYQTPWNVGLDDVDAIVRALKDAGEAEIWISKRIVAGVEYAQRDEHFARYQNVVPTLAAMKPGAILPEFAAEYVARCCEAFAFYGKGLAPELLKTGSKYEKETARAHRDLYLTPPIAWRHGADLDPAIFFSPKFPCAFAIVMPRKGEGKKDVIIELFVDRVRTNVKTKAA